MVEKKYLTIFLLVTAIIFILDQVSKYIVLKLSSQWSFSILSISITKNTGAGFGLFQGQTMWLSLISAIVAVGVILNYKKIPPQKTPQLLFALFLGGILGNLYDRIIHGHVIDFISISFWPSFNIADAAITIAVIGIIVYNFKKK